MVHKWHHYLPIYEKYFSPYRDVAPKFLEIGVSKGGSLALWRKYFGSKATIFGIDRDLACQALDGENGQVRIGSQDDPDFLKNVVSEMGGVDIILDDGSHAYFGFHRAGCGCLLHLFRICLDSYVPNRRGMGIACP